MGKKHLQQSHLGNRYVINRCSRMFQRSISIYIDIAQYNFINYKSLMSSLSSFFQKRDKSHKKDAAISDLFSQDNSKKFQNLPAELNPSTVAYLPPVPKPEQPENLESAIFIGNVPIGLKQREIKNLFSSYGKIEKVWFRSVPVEQNKMGTKANFILKNYAEGADSMNAYVRFSEKAAAEKACELNGTKVEEHTLRVFLCLDDNLDYQTTIFVGNMPLDIKEEELRTHFSQVGEIINVRVIRDKATYKGIGIGYVRFANKIDMFKAIQTMNSTKLKDRPLRVKRAIEKSKLQKKFNRVAQKKLAHRNYTPPQGQGKQIRAFQKPSEDFNPFISEQQRQKQQARKFHFKRKMIKK